MFLPGSDVASTGEYYLTNNKDLPTSGIIRVIRKGSLALPNGAEHQYVAEDRKVMFNDLAEAVESMQRMQSIDSSARFIAFRHFRMDDVKKYVKHPEKTVVVCHVPRRFDNLETAVDYASFGEVTEDFEFDGEMTPKGTIVVASKVLEYARKGYPIVLREENRGNPDLRDLYEQTGVVKAISGHFHESSHRANDRKGEHVKEGEFVNELFWNSGHFDSGAVGILTVDGEKAAYQNVRLQDYLK